MTLPPLPEPESVMAAAWDLVRSGPNYDGRDKNVIACVKSYALRYGEACAAAERERCAKVCDTIVEEYVQRGDYGQGYRVHIIATAERLATTIRLQAPAASLQLQLFNDKVSP